MITTRAHAIAHSMKENATPAIDSIADTFYVRNQERVDSPVWPRHQDHRLQQQSQQMVRRARYDEARVYLWAMQAQRLPVDPHPSLSRHHGIATVSPSAP